MIMRILIQPWYPARRTLDWAFRIFLGIGVAALGYTVLTLTEGVLY